MKKLFIFLFVLIGLGANAQTDTAVIGQDTVLVPLGAIVINPVIADAKGDSAWTMNFYAFDVKADTVSGCQTLVTLCNKSGQSIANFNQPLPSNIVNAWRVSPDPVYDYILSMNPRFIRYTKKVIYLNKP